jgi:hypothetical protein
MNGGRVAAARLAALAALTLPAGLLAACQPLPHPFANDRPSAALLKIRDTAGVSIASIVGGPPAIADRLGAAVAKALLKHDIPASATTTSLDSYQLYGRVAASRPHDGEATVTALWRLYDAKGHTVGERKARIDATTRDLASGSLPLVERLAGLSADRLAPLLEDAAPREAADAQPTGQIRVAVGKITGAPGDGATSLAAAVATVLKRLDLTVVDGRAKADLYVAGEVAVSPVNPHEEHIKIVWRVRRADGAQIGTVGEENDVPKGLLEGPWGDIAYNVAIAAGNGLAQLVARGAPAPKS